MSVFSKFKITPAAPLTGNFQGLCAQVRAEPVSIPGRCNPMIRSGGGRASVEACGREQNILRDVFSAFGIADDEGYRHQLPRIEVIDRDIASQIRVVEALAFAAFNDDIGCFGIVHARNLSDAGVGACPRQKYELAQRWHN